jgi:hypothetical protein
LACLAYHPFDFLFDLGAKSLSLVKICIRFPLATFMGPGGLISEGICRLGPNSSPPGQNIFAPIGQTLRRAQQLTLPVPDSLTYFMPGISTAIELETTTAFHPR